MVARVIKKRRDGVTQRYSDKKALIKRIRQAGIITEREIKLVIRRLNAGTYRYIDVDELTDLRITPEQTAKGLKWLRNKWMTPRAVERKNNPFRYREQRAIETFKEFRFNSFHDNTNYYQARMGIFNYVPIYDVIGEEGGFQYYVQDFEPKIIG